MKGQKPKCPEEQPFLWEDTITDLTKPLSCYACTEQAKCWVSKQDLSNLVNKLSTNCQQLLSRVGSFQFWGSCCFCRWPYPITAYEIGQRLSYFMSWKLRQLLTPLPPVFITSWWEMSWTALFYNFSLLIPGIHYICKTLE